MHSHNYVDIFSGKNYKKKTRYECARQSHCVIKTERDFAERLSPTENDQQQHQYFNKDESLGIEGVTAFFKPKNSDDYELRFYSFLSTDKTQDGKVVYANIKLMLEHIKSDSMEGTEVRWKIIDDTDGCAVQYRCGTALWMLQKLSNEMNIVYDRGIDAEGHGKKLIDGLSGVDKNYIIKEFRGNVSHQSGAAKEGKMDLTLYQVNERGKRKDLDEFSQKILSRED